MTDPFGVQLTYSSVDRGDGADPRTGALSVLRALRVPAALHDATAPWRGGEAVIAIPVTDDGRVLTLSDDDHVVTVLTKTELRSAFADAGMTLWLDVDHDVDAMDFDPAELAEAEAGAAVSAPQPIAVRAFSHRGPLAARFNAQTLGAPVEHVESGAWSLQRFSSDEPSVPWTSADADLPIVELNRTDDGGWFEVVTRGDVRVLFWPDAERDSTSVIDIATIGVPETADIVRRLLTEGDGSRDELEEVARAARIDADTAHRALIAESLGGIVGVEARQRAFLTAFGIPEALIDAAFADTALPVQRFAPTGWWPAITETLIDGMHAMTPLTRRDRPLARFARSIQRRPLLGAAISTSELAAGLALTRARGIGRVLGVLLVIDAVIDLVIWGIRLRRRS